MILIGRGLNLGKEQRGAEAEERSGDVSGSERGSGEKRGSEKKEDVKRRNSY